MSLIRFGTDHHAIATAPSLTGVTDEEDSDFISFGTHSNLSAPEMARLKYIFAIGAGLGLLAGIFFAKLQLMFVFGAGIGFIAGTVITRYPGAAP